jgi:hemolysin III
VRHRTPRTHDPDRFNGLSLIRDSFRATRPHASLSGAMIDWCLREGSRQEVRCGISSRRVSAIDGDTANHMYDGERFNAITHLAGAILALVGAVVLTVQASLDGDPWKVASVSIYGVTLVLLYSLSTLYHSLRGRAKNILRELDHDAIYLLIAGSYTPFCLVTLRGPWGWSLFGLVWGLAVLGALQELRPNNGPRILSVVIYVVMGWVALVATFPLLRALGSLGFAWLAAGGLFYTIGIVFYALDTRLTHAHGVWHLFVIAGSATHYVAILNYVV